jgi:hypothetical protein
MEPNKPIQPAPEPIQPTEQKIEPKKQLPKLKIAALIILLLLVLAVPFGGYLLLEKLGIHPKPSVTTIKTPTPTPIEEVKLPTLTASETASWRTYENKEEGWTIRYPSDKVSYYSNRFYVDGQTSNDTKTGELKINGFPASKVSIDTPDKNFEQDFFYLISTENGSKTIQYHFMSNKGMGLFDKNGNVIPAVSQESIDEMRQIVIKMLSTFKFTDQNTQTGETVNLITYTNAQYGFSFKHPQNWQVRNNISSRYYAQEMINPITISDQNSFSADIRVIENTGGISAKDFILKYFNPHNLDAAGNINDPPLKNVTFAEKTINGNKVTIINGLVGISGAGGPKAYLSHNNYSIFIEAQSGITPPLSEEEVESGLENFLSTFNFTQ